MSFQKILCPVDLSAASAEAARYAAALAAQRAGELTLLHVAPPLDLDFSMVEPAAARMADVASQRNQAIRHALNMFPGDPPLAVSAKRFLAEGDAAEQTVQFARDGGYDLIVMSTHGSGAIRRWLLVGSTTTKVLSMARCPVLAGTDFGSRFEHHAIRRIFRRIVAAVDMGSETRHVLCTAAGLAKENGASLSVVHAAPSLGEHAKDFFDEEWRTTLESRITTKIGEILREISPPDARLNANIQVECGSAAEIVANTVSRTEADLVLIGRSTHRGLVGRLKAQAYEIIRHCPCPVLSV